MAGIYDVRDALGYSPCRRCVNDCFWVDLQPKDCKYFPYKDLCTNCQTYGNIINDFTLSGRVKMLPKRAHW